MKKFVFSRETREELVVEAETLEEARTIANESLDFDWTKFDWTEPLLEDEEELE